MSDATFAGAVHAVRPMDINRNAVLSNGHRGEPSARVAHLDREQQPAINQLLDRASARLEPDGAIGVRLTDAPAPAQQEPFLIRRKPREIVGVHLTPPLAAGRGWAEDVGAEVVPGYAKSGLDCPGELWRHWATPGNPLTYKAWRGPDAPCESRLGASQINRFSDRCRVHGANIASLSTDVNSFAHRDVCPPLIALLYA